MNSKKYKFAFNYNNVIKYLEFDSGTEIGMLKWNLISNLPKGMKQNNPVFTYKGKPFTDNEYDIIDSIFKDKDETNEIKCEMAINVSSQSQNQHQNEKSTTTSKSDIIINSQSILNSLSAIESSSYFKFFSSYQKEMIVPIDALFIQMKKEIEKTLEEFIAKSKQSLTEYINIKQFENIKEGIKNIKINMEKILKDSNTIENLFNVYEDSMIEYKKIIAMTKNLAQRHNELLFIQHSINESISHLIQMSASFAQCYDYRAFIPYGTVGEGNGKEMLCKGFSFDDFITNTSTRDNNKISSSDKELTTSLQMIKNGKGISEQDLKYAEQLNINAFIEKVEEITFLRVERISKIKKRFESISDEIKKVQDRLVSHYNHPEDEQIYLASVTHKIKEVNSLISSKMTFEERKKKEASLLDLIKEIKVLDKKIKKKYDEILFDNKIIEIILNTSTRDFLCHINTKYDCITDIEKIKKIFDFNSLIIASNSKIELWKTCIDFRNENVLEIGDSLNNITTSNIQDLPLNGVNEQIAELMNIIPNKIDELNQTIDGFNKLNETLRKLTNDNKALMALIQNNTISIRAILHNTNCISGIISPHICNSNILLKQSEVDWISSLFPKETKYRLVYQASRDGCLSADFHRKCDGINDNLVIIETVNGFKFGGFTSKSWAINTGKSKGEDLKAFLLSITLMKRYEIENKKNAVYASNDHLCCFGDEIAILTNCLNRNDNYNMAPEQYLNEEEDAMVMAINDYLAGEKLFQVKELEVFHVITKDNNDYDLAKSY